MTTMVYTLQFTPIVKIWDGRLLLAGSLLTSLQVIIRLQNFSWYLINSIGVSILCVVAFYVFIGFIFLVIGRTITAKLYEKVDL